jgi:nucleoside-diphosphate-sugar epimerase
VTVLVTGASGFLGRVVCSELQERGHDVAALCRRPGSEPSGTTAVAGDLTDPQALLSAFAHTRPDAVIHLAAEIATQRDPARVREVNVGGTQRLIDAALASNRPKVVFASTVVTGQANGAVLDETSDLPVETAYGRSKQDGEQLLGASGLPHVVIRPSHVYGAGGWYEDEIVKRLRQPGRFAVVGTGENWWDVVRVEDVATACVDALERAPSGATYHVVDDEPIRYSDFVGLTATALGLGKPRHIPEWLARLAAGADPVRAVVRSAKSSNARIKSELGWSPRFPTAAVGVPDAIARMLAA